MPHTRLPSDADIALAVDRLRSGKLVAFPTETVYGLGADTFDEAALREIYRVKGRPTDNPLIAHVSGAVVARRIARDWDDRCDRLADAFWPGPLTLVLHRADEVPAAAAGGRSTIAVRAPRHEVAQKLLVAFGGAISAPSANRSGHISPTSAEHVAEDFADLDDLLILDGGHCALGVESTVLDLTTDPPRVLRPGSISPPTLHAVIGEVDRAVVLEQSESPGTSRAHYAPRTRAVQIDTQELGGWLDEQPLRAVVLCFDETVVPARHRAIVMPQGAGDYARVLYAALRRADALPFELIVVETPPESNEMWKVVHDRLGRAVGR